MRMRSSRSAFRIRFASIVTFPRRSSCLFQWESAVSRQHGAQPFGRLHPVLIVDVHWRDEEHIGTGVEHPPVTFACCPNMQGMIIERPIPVPARLPIELMLKRLVTQGAEHARMGKHVSGAGQIEGGGIESDT